jgi:hypothetical protein
MYFDGLGELHKSRDFGCFYFATPLILKTAVEQKHKICKAYIV